MFSVVIHFVFVIRKVRFYITCLFRGRFAQNPTKSISKSPKKKFPTRTFLELCSQAFLSAAKPVIGKQVCLAARNAGGFAGNAFGASLGNGHQTMTTTLFVASERFCFRFCEILSVSDPSCYNPFLFSSVEKCAANEIITNEMSHRCHRFPQIVGG